MTCDERLEIAEHIDNIGRKIRELGIEFEELSDLLGEIANNGTTVNETEKDKFLKRYS